MSAEKHDSLVVRIKMRLQFLPLLLMICHFSACKPDPELQRSYRAAVAGDWDEIHGTGETLHFEADGQLIMNSRSEHHTCTYDFPDAKHIRLDCVAPQIPHKPNTYGFALADDKLMISDDQSTGTYQKKQPPAADANTGDK